VAFRLYLIHESSSASLNITIGVPSTAPKQFQESWILTLKVEGLGPNATMGPFPRKYEELEAVPAAPPSDNRTIAIAASTMGGDDLTIAFDPATGVAVVYATKVSIPFTAVYGFSNVPTGVTVKVSNVVLKRYLAPNVTLDVNIPAFSRQQVNQALNAETADPGSESAPTAGSSGFQLPITTASTFLVGLGSLFFVL
jgi:hypothetical protein